MANVYSQVYIQLIFAVKGRSNLIRNDRREDVQKYITGIIQNKGQKVLAIYSNPDHIHILVGLNKFDVSISELVRDIKASSSKMINEECWFLGKFHWQEGYGVFSYSKSQIDQVAKYVLNQEAHHKKQTFRQEYVEILEKFEIDFKNEYLFEFYEGEEGN
ncbi:IS200/IS605 family transposase [Chryseobacterium suipulveris]|uniref:IS200/IS605 family transposase n=1 Tax=Chryseobacterium suipulveris TaxID=2929800 RepID=A0ABY4BR53_9FLAO|nr:IS200/IS605 family transposase [Chryseobacterium suipulveris]UOE41667.1 IS200/IS605 family transposase [Chryseobacterium suipulveris]